MPKSLAAAYAEVLREFDSVFASVNLPADFMADLFEDILPPDADAVDKQRIRAHLERARLAADYPEEQLLPPGLALLTR